MSVPRPARSQAVVERCVGVEWPVLAGFGRFFEGLHYQFIVLGGDVAGAQEGDAPWLMSIEPNCRQPSFGPANRHVRPLFRLPHKPTSVGSPGFDGCADSLTRRWVRFEEKPAHVAGFVPAHATPSDSRPPAPRCRGRTSTASSCRPTGAICSSEVARRRDGRNGVPRFRHRRKPGPDADRRPEQRLSYLVFTLEFEPRISW
jgi:hypothetical protein